MPSCSNSKHLLDSFSVIVGSALFWRHTSCMNVLSYNPDASPIVSDTKGRKPPNIFLSSCLSSSSVQPIDCLVFSCTRLLHFCKFHHPLGLFWNPRIAGTKKMWYQFLFPYWKPTRARAKYYEQFEHDEHTSVLDLNVSAVVRQKSHLQSFLPHVDVLLVTVFFLSSWTK